MTAILVRRRAAIRVHRLAEAIWRTWRMEEVVNLSRYDLAVISVVARLDDLAERLAS